MAAESISQGLVRGFLHVPENPRAALALTHGAGSNCRAPLLTAVAGALAEHGIATLRFDLPFRQSRPGGPPFPAQAARDREGIRAAAELLRERFRLPVHLGGHSYGGRQASMAAAEDRQTADALLLLSYPLHPPNKPDQLRTAHFPNLHTPVLFVHGARDPFATPAEIRAAIALIPASCELIEIERAGHSLPPAIAEQVAGRFRAMLAI